VADTITAPSQASRTRAADQPAHPLVKAGGGGLLLAALGVVFGDIGTSPLYSLQTVFTLDHGLVRATPTDVYGVVSMMFWAVTLVVSFKYVSIVMRADNDGEGGIMALAALARRLRGHAGRTAAALMALGMLGASLFYGDSLITPAISVLSAVEGLKVPFPGLAPVVVPIAMTILAVLFAFQRFGTAKVGALFGPVMLVWFAALALAGIGPVAEHPGVVAALSPHYAVLFAAEHPFVSFVAMGAVVLCITGAEALYADMGHFGRAPIRRAWFFVVFPALTVNYLGQAAEVLASPAHARNPFFLLLPAWAQVPMVVLATLATVIASQAVVSGAFSMTRQASRLELLPPLKVIQTHEHEAGQVYLPAVNAALFVGVMALTITFGSSAKLASAYGVSVTGALLLDTVLLLTVARRLFGWSRRTLVAIGGVLAWVEASFLAANLTKVAHGGWLPLLIAAVMFTIMSTWQTGRRSVTANRLAREGSLAQFLDEVHSSGVPRMAGTAVFPHRSKTTVPLALRSMVEHQRMLPEHVLVVSVVAENVPHVSAEERLELDDLGNPSDGVWHLTVHQGFSDALDIPAALEQARQEGLLARGMDLATASYFLSQASITPVAGGCMHRWRKALFVALSQNTSPPDFRLPPARTVTIGVQVAC
jgi:KUP system potassium uptake protein